MFQLVVNILGTVTAGICAVLLLRAFSSVHKRLLLWAGLCFTVLTVANALLIADLNFVPDVSLYRWRLGTAAAAMLLMLYGLIFESDQS